jgi:cytochrome c oxidase subunit 4
MSAHGNETHHIVPYKVYVYVWAALVILTGITVGASYANLAHVAILTAILIATVKGSLVLMYFMHIRFERPIFLVMILATLITYGIFIGLTFTDYFYR